MLYKAWITRVVDGDTLCALVETWPSDYKDIRIRLLGVDAPEMRGEEREAGLISTGWVRGQLAHADHVRIEPYEADDFGRWLCKVLYQDEDGTTQNLSTSLLQAGMAEVYSRSADDNSPIQMPAWGR